MSTKQRTLVSDNTGTLFFHSTKPASINFVMGYWTAGISPVLGLNPNLLDLSDLMASKQIVGCYCGRRPAKKA